MKKNFKIAVKFEIINGRIYLFDDSGGKLPGKGTHFAGGFYCSGNQLTTLEGAPESVGGGFYCYGNQLTTLEGAPESVGGDFNCSGNQLTTLEGAPEERQQMFSVFLSAGYVFADGILTRKKSQRKISAEVTLYKTEKLGFKKNPPVVYVIKSGDLFAHGKTAEEASDALVYKTTSRDVSAYKAMPLDTMKTPGGWAAVYHVVSGACETGCKMFMEKQRGIKKQYTLAEILDATKGQYGYDRFKDVVCGGGR